LEEDEGEVDRDELLHGRHHRVVLMVELHPQEDPQSLNRGELLLQQSEDGCVQTLYDQLVCDFIHTNQFVHLEVHEELRRLVVAELEQNSEVVGQTVLDFDLVNLVQMNDYGWQANLLSFATLLLVLRTGFFFCAGSRSGLEQT